MRGPNFGAALHLSSLLEIFNQLPIYLEIDNLSAFDLNKWKDSHLNYRQTRLI